jgi:hypothetical protein
MPGTQSHEEKETKNIFTRTQDSAFLAKEIIQDEIAKKLEKGKRPNIICDCVTLEPCMREWLDQGKVTSIVTAYRGEPGYMGIAERADNRARNDPVDKGRFVETTELLTKHADASKKLLSSIPENVITTVLDTSVEKEEQPKEIAKIDSKSHIMEISNLRVMSEFLNKRNINTFAINQVDLILNSNPLNLLVTHPEMKAKAILDLVPEAEYKPAYRVQLKGKMKEEDTDEDKIIYAELVLVEGAVKLSIVNNQVFDKIAMSNNIESSVLRAITRQAIMGTLTASFESAYELNDIESFKKAKAMMSSKEHQVELSAPSKNPTSQI